MVDPYADPPHPTAPRPEKANKQKSLEKEKETNGFLLSIVSLFQDISQSGFFIFRFFPHHLSATQARLMFLIIVPIYCLLETVCFCNSPFIKMPDNSPSHNLPSTVK